jgi:hypothetical protein
MAQQTTGLGTPTQIVVDSTNVTLSLSGTTTHQINPQIQDAGGNEQATGTPLVLTAVAASSGGTAVYTGTITGGAANAFAGKTFVVAGFAGANNDGTFVATASSATTLTLENGAATAETHAGTATQQESTSLTYVAYGASNVVSGSKVAVATVSANGLITATAEGSTTVEVSYTSFNNAVGDIVSAGNIMNGLPINKIYTTINVNVVA